MRQVWLTFRKDLTRVLRDPVALAAWAAIPLSILLLLYFLFGRPEGVQPHGRLLVADEDGSLLSRGLASAFQQGPLESMFELERVEAAAGRARMQKGGATALLIIPKGFGGAVLANQPARVRLIKNPSQTILPGIAEEVLAISSDAVFYAHLMAGEQLRTLAAMHQAPTDAQVVAMSLAVHRLVTDLRRYLSPPLIDLDTPTTTPPRKQFDFAVLFFSGLAFLSILFMARGTSADLWQEHTSGTLRRLCMSAATPAAILAGKALAAGAVGFAISTVSLAVGRLALSIPVANFPLATLWLTAAGLAAYCLMALLQMSASTRVGGDLVSSFFLFPLAMLGGSFFPLATMPASIAAVGRASPVGWAVTRLQAIMNGTATGADLAVWFAVMAAAAGLCFLLAVVQMRRRFLPR